jgi:hypothetical protein
MEKLQLVDEDIDIFGTFVGSLLLKSATYTIINNWKYQHETQNTSGTLNKLRWHENIKFLMNAKQWKPFELISSTSHISWNAKQRDATPSLINNYSKFGDNWGSFIRVFCVNIATLRKSFCSKCWNKQFLIILSNIHCQTPQMEKIHSCLGLFF